MLNLKLLASLSVCAVLAGCAHPIVISPDISKISGKPGSSLITKNVGYYIAPELQNLKVKSAGGGGDFVSYTPYKDTETAFYKMLTNTFTSVTRLSSPTDTAVISKQSINYIIVPEIMTTSSSSSPFTWPPTQFVVTLSCKISDTTGKVVAQPSVVGSGHAEFSEFKSDFSLSGKRATEDALLKMQDVLQQQPQLRTN